MRIDVWSDIACPWCWVGKRRLEAALARFPHRDRVEVVWRAFELDPSAPREHPARPGYVERLARKYGSSVVQAEKMIANMVEVGRGDGIDFRFDRVRSGNTFDAHRLLHLGAERGKQDALKERFLRGYMTEGAPIGDHETLVKLAGEAGLDEEEARATLASDAYALAVRTEEEEASEIGIRGVPFFVLGGKYAVSGAQPAELLLRAIQQAWDETEKPVVLAEGAVCGPDGCN